MLRYLYAWFSCKNPLENYLSDHTWVLPAKASYVCANFSSRWASIDSSQNIRWRSQIFSNYKGLRINYNINNNNYKPDDIVFARCRFSSYDGDDNFPPMSGGGVGGVGSNSGGGGVGVPMQPNGGRRVVNRWDWFELYIMRLTQLFQGTISQTSGRASRHVLSFRLIKNSIVRWHFSDEVSSVSRIWDVV